MNRSKVWYALRRGRLKKNRSIPRDLLEQETNRARELRDAHRETFRLQGEVDFLTKQLEAVERDITVLRMKADNSETKALVLQRRLDEEIKLRHAAEGWLEQRTHELEKLKNKKSRRRRAWNWLKAKFRRKK